MRIVFLAVTLTAFAGCSQPDQGLARNDSTPSWRQPGDKVDSILPMEEYERRFREGLNRVTELSGGADSRERLAERFMGAVAARDTAALAALMITPAEFSWLVYPHHAYREEPYALDPAIFWMQVEAASAKGARRLFDRYGTHSLQLEAIRCERDTTSARAPLILWAPCEVVLKRDGTAETGRYFGSIVERDGVFKLMSAAGDM